MGALVIARDHVYFFTVEMKEKKKRSAKHENKHMNKVIAFCGH